MTGCRATDEYKLTNQLPVHAWEKLMEEARLLDWEEYWARSVIAWHHRDSRARWKLIDGKEPQNPLYFSLINVDENEVTRILESLLRQYKG